MRRMLIDDDNPICCLRYDIGVMHLPARCAQAMETGSGSFGRTSLAPVACIRASKASAMSLPSWKRSAQPLRHGNR